jgi:hypothetical protein
MRLRGGRFPPVDHYAQAVFSQPGHQCWRFVVNRDPRTEGQPTHCPEPVMYVGNHRMVGGKRIRVWSCEAHLKGVEKPERVGHG